MFRDPQRPKQIVRILASLLSNAAKFTDRGEILAGVELANDPHRCTAYGTPGSG